MKRIKFGIGLGIAVLTHQPALFAEGKVSPSEKATQIAQKQAHLKNLLQRLRKEAEHIQNPLFAKDAKIIPETPQFSIVKAHQKHEKQLAEKLEAEGLYKSVQDQSLFPKNEPMPFISAPGSVWRSHHSYPGGLLYHTLTNLKLGLSYSQTYKEIYRIQLRQDYIRMAALMHDSAKTLTIVWNEDGSCTENEVGIANTSAHHIWAIAEAIERKYPTDFIVTLASAHSPPLAGKSLSDLVGFLKAASILAEVPYEKAGLSPDGKTLASLPPIEAFITHLDDHDYVLTETSIDAVDVMEKVKGLDFWKRNELLSKEGDLPIYLKAASH